MYDNMYSEEEEGATQKAVDVYDHQLDKLFHRYEEALRCETYLLCNVDFDSLLVDFTIQCGLSSAINFEPAIRLVKQDERISFCASEWIEFVGVLRHLNCVYFNEETVTSTPRFYTFWWDATLTLNNDCDVFKSIVISRNNISFNFTKYDVIETLSMQTSILIEIEQLLKMCFHSYYDRLLTCVNGMIEIGQGVDDTEVLAIVKSLCKITNDGNDMQNKCMNEMISYYSSKIILDFSYNYKTI